MNKKSQQSTIEQVRNKIFMSITCIMNEIQDLVKLGIKKPIFGNEHEMLIARIEENKHFLYILNELLECCDERE